MRPQSLILLVLSYAFASSAQTSNGSGSSTTNTNSTCGNVLSHNTTTEFSIIHNNVVTNTTNDLQALLVTQYRVGHSNASCNGSTSMVLWGDSLVGAYIGPYVSLDDFAYTIVSALRNDIRANGTTGSVIIESCTIDPVYAGQNIGIYVSSFGNVPLVQNAISTWTYGGCMTTPSTINSTASPWKSFSLHLQGPPPSINSTSNSSTSASISSTKTATAHSSLSSINTATHASSLSSKTTTVPTSQKQLTSSSVSSHIPAAAASATKHARSLFSRGDCTAIQVQSGDSCGSLASKCGISGAQFTKYNPQSNLCSTLAPGQHVCCSPGTLPDYAPKPQSDGTCATYTVAAGDSCSAIASANSLTVTQLEGFNKNTWGFPGCSDLQIGAVICLSTGNPPMPAAVQNAVCGPQVPGTATPANISQPGALASLNPCPLKVCCDIWGQCGNTAEFCTPSKSASGAPGTAAPGENGCVSNCGTQIVSSSPPAKFLVVEYFEGYNWQRPCLNMDASSVNVEYLTHLHFGFADLSDSYVPSINSSMTDQWNQFLNISGPARILSFGGWAFSTDIDTYAIFRNGVTAANRQTFANNVAAFVSSSGIDGVDFDWEYPGAPDIPGIPAASPQNGQDYLAFLKLLRAALPAGKIISLAAPASYWYLRNYPIAEMSEVVDYIVYMTYDLHGQWDYGNAYSDPGCPGGNCLRSMINSTETNTALSMITKAGVPSNKILVGITSYGRSFQMTQPGCTGPMCTYTGPLSGATPGECTQTAGYLAQAEIDLILSTDPSASTYHDSSSDSDVLVYNDTQWVSYMNVTTRNLRIIEYFEAAFLGTVNWAVDLQAFTAEEAQTIDPLPNCTDFGNYQTMDEIIADDSIPEACMNMYLTNVLAFNMSGSLSDYHSIMENGYSGKYNAYAREVRNEGSTTWNSIFADQSQYWNCFQTRSGTNVSTACGGVPNVDGNIYYVYKNETDFCATVESLYGFDCDWVTESTQTFQISSSSEGCKRFGMCPDGGTMYYPDFDQNFAVFDPSQAITSGLVNYTDFSGWLSDTAVLANIYMNPAANADVVDAAASIVFGLSGSVQAMQQVADVGAQAEKQQREEMVIAFLTAFLLIIPGIGEAADSVDALAQVARISKLVDVVGNTALSLYGVVQDPSSAPMAIAGILFGAVGLRDESAWGKGAKEARSMTKDVIDSMGATVSDGLSKIKQTCKECSA